MFRGSEMKMEKEIEEEIILDSAHRESLKVLRRDSIELDEFKDIYGDEEVENDKSETERLRNIHREKLQKDPERAQLKRFATIFEAIIHQHGEQAEWFGPEAYTIKTSDYDDFSNKVDEVIEFRRESPAEGKEISHLTLGIDVTTIGSLDEKLRSVWKKVKSGNLSEVKYFSSEEAGKGKLDHVPSVVINAEPREIKEMMELWLERKNGEIAVHPMQIRILEQMEGQLEIFQEWAEEKGKGDLEKIFGERLGIIRNILEGKGELKKELEMEGKIMRGDLSPKELIKADLRRIINEDY